MIACTVHPEKRAHARGFCNACLVKHRYDNDPEYRAKRIATAKAWHAAHPDRVRAISQKSKAKSCPVKRRDRTLRKKYGITNDDYVQILAEQNGRCAICVQTPAVGKWLHVDHDHRTGAVRGLLCHQCNWYLGKVDRDPAVLARLAAYAGAAA